MRRTVEAEVCVIGSGPAGLTLAEELARAGRSVVILERGGRRLDRSRHAQNTPVSAGHPIGRADRIRRFALGGAGWIWAGMAPEFSERDFEVLPQHGQIGWPFGRDHLLPFYDRARRLLGLPARAGEECRDVSEALALWTMWRSPLRFGQRAPPGALLQAAVRRLRASRDGKSVEYADVVGARGEEFQVRSRFFVLAAGGIETPRLLLHSRIGNDHDLVGRFFADHPYLTVPLRDRVEPAPTALYERAARPEQLLGFSDSFRRSAGVPGVAAFLRILRDPPPGPERGLTAWRDLRWGIEYGEPPPALLATLCHATLAAPAAARAFLTRKQRTGGLALRIVLEPRPNPASRITLSPRCDRFGVPLPHVDWRLDEDGGKTLARFFQALAELDPPWGPLETTDADPWPQLVEHGAHHMGTTRMHPDPRRGVVDADCGVHGIENLFIAGSSVFPSYGFANPTITILALAFRLADHLRALH